MNQRNLQLLQADAALAGTDDALRGGIVRHADLMAWLKDTAGLHLMGYRATLINQAVAGRIIYKSRDHVGRIIYALPSQQPLSLFDSS